MGKNRRCITYRPAQLFKIRFIMCRGILSLGIMTGKLVSEC